MKEVLKVKEWLFFKDEPTRTIQDVLNDFDTAIQKKELYHKYISKYIFMINELDEKIIGNIDYYKSIPIKVGNLLGESVKPFLIKRVDTFEQVFVFGRQE